MTADTMGYSRILHRCLANALKLSICGLYKLCALGRVLIATKDINGDTNLDKPPIIAELLHILDSVVVKLVCLRIECVYILRLTNTDEKGRHLNYKSSLDTGDAHLVEVIVESLKAN